MALILGAAIAYLIVSIGMPLGIPQLYRQGRKRGMRSRRSDVPQSAEEADQFDTIIELWMEYRDHLIPGDWFVDVERITWGAV